MTGKDTQASGRVMNAINLTLPPLRAKNPRLWFAEVEALFRTHGIEDEILKYSYVEQTLPIHISQEVEDLICNNSNPASYSQLKETLIQRFDSRKKVT